MSKQPNKNYSSAGDNFSDDEIVRYFTDENPSQFAFDNILNIMKTGIFLFQNKMQTRVLNVKI